MITTQNKINSSRQTILRILIIDDNPEIHKDFLKILTINTPNQNLNDLEESIFGETTKKIQLPEFQIDTASQGKEGVEFIEQALQQGNPYALAFVDIRMPPGWDGIETIKHIWEIDPDIQVVICTAYSDYSWEETIEHLGQKENLLILKKPFDHVSVRQLAYALTKKWQLLQETRSYTTSLEETVKERTKEIEYQATHDLLTGLPNRAMLIERIRYEIAKEIREKTKFAIFFFDLDRFKLVNDSFGHAAGDKLLQIIADKFTKKIRQMDMLARIGGDEFVGIFSSINDKNSIETIANTLIETLKKPISINDHDIVVTSSIGIAMFPNDGDNADDLLRNADMAMYKAKEKGGNQFCYYTEELSSICLERLEMEADLHNAVKNNELFLEFQPQYDITTNQFASVEALIRWNHSRKGRLLPIDFIPFAEQTGLISIIGNWVLENACQQNKKWQEMGLPPLRVAVNITPDQFKQPDFVSMIKALLEKMDLEPKYLELELTENMIINNLEFVNKIVQLREMGIYIALDDFGTGYSSLNYLRNIPLDRLKIDKSFIDNIDINYNDEILIKAIVSMAKSLSLDILAEGVETQKQLDFLKSTKCIDIQGFYFSKPLSPTALEELLRNPSQVSKIVSEKKDNHSK